MKENKLVINLKNAIETTKAKIIYNVNTELLKLYMYIGEQIQKDIDSNKGKSDYKKRTISSISNELTKEFGSGYSRRNIKAMLNFYIIYKNWETLFPTLSWGHYFCLLNVKNDEERKFYEIECAKQRWSVRDLKRQIQSGYYQRILLGSKENIEAKKNQLSTLGNQIVEPKDVMVDPIVINFFKKGFNLREKEIEKGIITHMKEFLLELGSGFRFI